MSRKELTHTMRDLSGVDFSLNSEIPPINRAYEIPPIAIHNALQTVLRQLVAAGRRPRTIQTYEISFKQFIKACNIEYVADIDVNSLYDFLESLEGLALSTKRVRLKAVKAVLLRFFENGWINRIFWRSVDVKVDKKIKEGADVTDLAYLIQKIDKTTFTGYRDVVAILLIFKTGIRIRTLGDLTTDHINVERKELVLPGEIMKGRRPVILPLDDDILEKIALLMEQNATVKRHNKKRNKHIFITMKGDPVNSAKGYCNALSKSLSAYAKRYGLKNVNAHSIRRTYAKNLLDKGASIALISKALGHSDLSVTTDYLHLSLQEVSNDLRDYL